MTKAVITVVGKDAVGIISNVSRVCADNTVNILDITQTVIGEYFAMVMLTDITRLSCPFADFVNTLEELGRDNGLEIHAMHEDIFNTMHHI